ncbi:hypothetical protein HKX48_008411 [Thoreauomyces humboldtii]|nr:hypothetical protein HKX48_008411 [Thoreauomyces humboldtii]
MILAILFALLVLVAVVAFAPVALKALEERVSVDVLEEDLSILAVLEEGPSVAEQVLAAARLKLMRRLVRDCRKSEVGTCLPGWSENNTLTGTLNQNARLASIMALTHLNLPGTKLRGEEYTSMTDLAGELIGASNWAAAQSIQRKLRPAPRKVSMLVPNNAKNVRAHFAVDKRPKVGCNRQSKAQVTGPGEMPLVEGDDIVDFGGNTRAFFLSAPIFNQTYATVEPEVVAVAEEGGLDATVEQEIVVVVADKVKKVEEVQATVEQQIVAVVIATVEQEVVAVVNEFGEIDPSTFVRQLGLPVHDRADVNEACFLLALFGWEFHAIGTNPFLRCSLCARQAGLWNFDLNIPSANSTEPPRKRTRFMDSETGAMVPSTFDARKQHRWFCPWITRDPKSGQRKLGWIAILDSITVAASKADRYTKPRRVNQTQTQNPSIFDKSVNSASPNLKDGRTSTTFPTPQVEALTASEVAIPAAKGNQTQSVIHVEALIPAPEPTDSPRTSEPQTTDIPVADDSNDAAGQSLPIATPSSVPPTSAFPAETSTLSSAATKLLTPRDNVTTLSPIIQTEERDTSGHPLSGDPTETSRDNVTTLAPTVQNTEQMETSGHPLSGDLKETFPATGLETVEPPVMEAEPAESATLAEPDAVVQNEEDESDAPFIAETLDPMDITEPPVELEEAQEAVAMHSADALVADSLVGTAPRQPPSASTPSADLAEPPESQDGSAEDLGTLSVRVDVDTATDAVVDEDRPADAADTSADPSSLHDSARNLASGIVDRGEQDVPEETAEPRFSHVEPEADEAGVVKFSEEGATIEEIPVPDNQTNTVAAEEPEDEPPSTPFTSDEALALDLDKSEMEVDSLDRMETTDLPGKELESFAVYDTEDGTDLAEIVAPVESDKAVVVLAEAVPALAVDIEENETGNESQELDEVPVTEVMSGTDADGGTDLQNVSLEVETSVTTDVQPAGSKEEQQNQVSLEAIDEPFVLLPDNIDAVISTDVEHVSSEIETSVTASQPVDSKEEEDRVSLESKDEPFVLLDAEDLSSMNDLPTGDDDVLSVDEPSDLTVATEPIDLASPGDNLDIASSHSSVGNGGSRTYEVEMIEADLVIDPTTGTAEADMDVDEVPPAEDQAPDMMSVDVDMDVEVTEKVERPKSEVDVPGEMNLESDASLDVDNMQVDTLVSEQESIPSQEVKVSDGCGDVTQEPAVDDTVSEMVASSLQKPDVPQEVHPERDVAFFEDKVQASRSAMDIAAKAIENLASGLNRDSLSSPQAIEEVITVDADMLQDVTAEELDSALVRGQALLKRDAGFETASDASDHIDPLPETPSAAHGHSEGEEDEAQEEDEEMYADSNLPFTQEEPLSSPPRWEQHDSRQHVDVDMTEVYEDTTEGADYDDEGEDEGLGDENNIDETDPIYGTEEELEYVDDSEDDADQNLLYGSPSHENGTEYPIPDESEYESVSEDEYEDDEDETTNPYRVEPFAHRPLPHSGPGVVQQDDEVILIESSSDDEGDQPPVPTSTMRHVTDMPSSPVLPLPSMTAGSSPAHNLSEDDSAALGFVEVSEGEYEDFEEQQQVEGEEEEEEEVEGERESLEEGGGEEAAA